MLLPLASLSAASTQPAFGGSFEADPIPGKAGVRLLKNDAWFDSQSQVHWLAHAGLETDGASIPEVLRFWLGGPFDEPQLRPGIVHDGACDAIRKAYDLPNPVTWAEILARRKRADEMIREACVAATMSKWRANLFYVGVRIGALLGVGMPTARQGDLSLELAATAPWINKIFSHQDRAALRWSLEIPPGIAQPTGEADATCTQQHALAEELLRRLVPTASNPSPTPSAGPTSAAPSVPPLKKFSLKADEMLLKPVPPPSSVMSSDLAKDLFERTEGKLTAKGEGEDSTIAATDAALIDALRDKLAATPP